MKKQEALTLLADKEMKARFIASRQNKDENRWLFTLGRYEASRSEKPDEDDDWFVLAVCKETLDIRWDGMMQCNGGASRIFSDRHTDCGNAHQASRTPIPGVWLWDMD